MKRLEVSGAVRPLKWPLGVKWLKHNSSEIFSDVDVGGVLHTGIY
jgi:hypothetical protein